MSLNIMSFFCDMTISTLCLKSRRAGGGLSSSFLGDVNKACANIFCASVWLWHRRRESAGSRGTEGSERRKRPRGNKCPPTVHIEIPRVGTGKLGL